MKIPIIIVTVITVINFILTPATYAQECTKTSDCPSNQVCAPSQTDPNTFICTALSDSERIFGKVTPPNPIDALGVGALGLSKFFNNLISLIYIIAAVIFVFMLLWGGLQWLSSGGDKDAVKAARERITHALVGITILAVAFAILRVVGLFTGFTFFFTP